MGRYRPDDDRRKLTMPDPEALARKEINRLLTQAGWIVVERSMEAIEVETGAS